MSIQHKCQAHPKIPRTWCVACNKQAPTKATPAPSAPYKHTCIFLRSGYCPCGKRAPTKTTLTPTKVVNKAIFNTSGRISPRKSAVFAKGNLSVFDLDMEMANIAAWTAVEPFCPFNDIEAPKGTNCKCGSTSIGGLAHSTWCCLFKGQ